MPAKYTYIFTVISVITAPLSNNAPPTPLTPTILVRYFGKAEIVLRSKPNLETGLQKWKTKFVTKVNIHRTVKSFAGVHET